MGDGTLHDLPMIFHHIPLISKREKHMKNCLILHALQHGIPDPRHPQTFTSRGFHPFLWGSPEKNHPYSYGIFRSKPSIFSWNFPIYTIHFYGIFRSKPSFLGFSYGFPMVCGTPFKRFPMVHGKNPELQTARDPSETADPPPAQRPWRIITW